jgi:hypothetical protein
MTIETDDSLPGALEHERHGCYQEHSLKFFLRA